LVKESLTIAAGDPEVPKNKSPVWLSPNPTVISPKDVGRWRVGVPIRASIATVDDCWLGVREYRYNVLSEPATKWVCPLKATADTSSVGDCAGDTLFRISRSLEIW